ncbi:DUF2294 domain-containing protein [Ammoniphilus sp. CFH 90114]|uniref:DUF2294 domain-containing protein n=1 Tax=Ammoniphilus sp. CFH 90114 TaxID=2493665 RepID=UPI0013E933E5|nr:Na-translocating system protein MpsC family protein [Ammoniphilus sp. CFH 90114]
MNKPVNVKSLEIEIANFINAFIKEGSGKGPKVTTVKVVDNVLIYFLNGIFTPLEKKLLETEEGKRHILEGRRLYVKVREKQRKAEIERIVGLKVVKDYYSWNIDDDSALSVVVFEENILDGNRN